MTNSDVRIVTSIDGFNELNSFINNYIKEHPKEEVKNILNKVDLKYENTKQCYFGWNNRSWNEYYHKSVAIVMEGLRHLVDSKYTVNYYRLGEDKDDYDEFRNYADREGFLDEPNIIRKFDDRYMCDLIYGQKSQELESKESIDYE